MLQELMRFTEYFEKGKDVCIMVTVKSGARGLKSGAEGKALAGPWPSSH